MKLMDSVYMVGSGTAGFSMTNAFDCTVYLVDGKDELALIDAGVGVQPERIIKQIERDGFDPAQIGKILLTHGQVIKAVQILGQVDQLLYAAGILA